MRLKYEPASLGLILTARFAQSSAALTPAPSFLITKKPTPCFLERTVSCDEVQEFLTHKKLLPPMTLQQACLGPYADPRRGAVSDQRGTSDALYGGTSLSRKRTSLGPYRRPLPRFLGGS